jgi:hypothetical protein
MRAPCPGRVHAAITAVTCVVVATAGLLAVIFRTATVIVALAVLGGDTAGRSTTWSLCRLCAIIRIFRLVHFVIMVVIVVVVVVLVAVDGHVLAPVSASSRCVVAVTLIAAWRVLIGTYRRRRRRRQASRQMRRGVLIVREEIDADVSILPMTTVVHNAACYAVVSLPVSFVLYSVLI